MRSFIVPPMSPLRYKGQAGKVATVGGSLEYTGAPYLAAMAALRVGADLSHVFCTKDAAIPIKTYAPDLIVHPLLQVDVNLSQAAAQAVEKWLPSMQSLVIGPGLGRDEGIMQTARSLLSMAVRSPNLRVVVLDGDGLWAVRDHLDLVRELGPRVILTPNRVEWQRLQAQLNLSADQDDGRTVSQKLNGAMIVRKGPIDSVSNASESVPVTEPGSLKRSGGQGDILAGTIAVFAGWSDGPQVASVAAACAVVRRAAHLAWEKHHRAMIATDVLQEMGPAMHALHPPVVSDETANL